MNTRTTPLPPVDLTDPIWTVEHVAALAELAALPTARELAR